MRSPMMDPSLVRVLDEAEKVAKKAGDSFVPVERILMALALVPHARPRTRWMRGR